MFFRLPYAYLKISMINNNFFMLINRLREFNLRKRKFVSSHESIYELENYPEYTPKRMKVQYGDKSFFLKPDEAQK